MARRGANGSGSLLLEPIPSGVKGAGLRNFAFINVSYTVPPGLLSRKKQGNIILDSIRQAGRIKSIHWMGPMPNAASYSCIDGGMGRAFCSFALAP